jgi:hypothetical protein
MIPIPGDPFALPSQNSDPIRGPIFIHLNMECLRSASCFLKSIFTGTGYCSASLFRTWQLIPNFFIAHLPILVRCKTKGAVGAVCALPGNWKLNAQLPVTVRDGAVTLKGMGTGGFFLKPSAPLSLMTTYRMSLISAGAILLDSTVPLST